MADENLENQTETQAEEQGAVQGEAQGAGANANRVKLGEGVYLEVTRVEVVGNLYDENGAPLGDGNYAVNLNGAEVVSLGISDIQVLADKFNASAEA